jgi:hypothetical protein
VQSLRFLSSRPDFRAAAPLLIQGVLGTKKRQGGVLSGMTVLSTHHLRTPQTEMGPEHFPESSASLKDSQRTQSSWMLPDGGHWPLKLISSGQVW